MQCEKCGSEFEQTGRYAKKFCSRRCSNSGRKASPEGQEARSKKVREWLASRSEEEIKRSVQKGVKTLKSNIESRMISSEFDELSLDLKRKRISFEQDHKCLECSIPNEWNGKPLTFHVDHISGDRSDNSRENLRMLCPNCHSQTETYGSKNQRRVNDEALRVALKENPNIYQALMVVGLAPTKKNYDRARCLLE